MKGIAVSAILSKITNTVDGGWRITFDVADNERDRIKELMDHTGDLLQLGIVPHSELQAGDESGWNELSDELK